VAWSFRPVRPDPDYPARILVTSGSETEPKMVAYSHNAVAGGRGTMLAELHDKPADMRNLFLVPLASAFGSSGTPVTLGGTPLLQPGFDPGATLRFIERARPTHLLGVLAMLRMLLDHPDLRSTDTTSLRAVVLGGSALNEPTARRWRESLGLSRDQPLRLSGPRSASPMTNCVTCPRVRQARSSPAVP
jgi:acyl-CoA synthetase (AMP-forming)/AMP-acid ligase II